MRVFNVIKKAIKWYINQSAKIYMTPSGMIPIIRQ